MSPERWQQIDEIYHAALEREPEGRNAFLEHACAGDGDLRREVESLLAHERSGSALLDPIEQQARKLLRGIGSSPRMAPGTQLGPYRIVSELGAGGMGEVYRARDTRLDRTVALKVLPAHLRDDPELKKRFEREARVVSSLNHPNICTLHDIGSQDGVDYLVMEYLEGETLAQRLERGPLSLDQVLDYAIQIAGALSQAHEQGVSHRDLKPGNIMLTKSGAKLLDFGLAKRWSASQDGGTVTDLTEQGTILGTLHYMAPEQLEGKPAGASCDIFSLGTAIYEMAAGRKAFPGDSQASVIASILSSEPPALSMLPAELNRIVSACLAKIPEQRWHCAKDLVRELTWVREPRTNAGGASKRKSGLWPWIPAALGILAALASLFLYLRPIAQHNLLRFDVFPPPEMQFAWTADGAIKISPDGHGLAFVAHGQDQIMNLWFHDFETASARMIADTRGASHPFWSPDSRSIAFFADGKLKRVPRAGGAPQSLCDAPAIPRGGTWSRNDVILFVTHAGDQGGLFQVNAGGGIPKRVTALDVSGHEAWHWWPQFLPDGKHFIYLASIGGRVEARAGSLDGRGYVSLLRSNSAVVYAAASASHTGHLLFMANDRLMARSFDPESLKLQGDPVPIAQYVETGTAYREANFSASENEVLTFYARKGLPLSQLVWFDRSGKPIRSVGAPSSAEPRNSQLRLSPDEKKLAITRVDPHGGRRDDAGRQIWLLDLEQNTESKLTFERGQNICSVFSSDGAFLAFSGPQYRSGVRTTGIHRRALGGLRHEELIHDAAGLVAYPSDWSKDGRFILYVQLDAIQSKGALWVLPLFGDQKPTPYFQTTADTKQGQFSPDGRWVAYTSDESGRPEVYVQGFPVNGGKWQISSNQGAHPLWRRDGAELYFIAGDGNLMAVPVRTGATFEHGVPVVLFQSHREPVLNPYLDMQYATSNDGQRFLIATPVANSLPVTVMVNWTVGLKREKQ